MFKQVGTFLSNIYFLFEISWIIISTYLYFLYNKDYVLFIQNITHRLSSKNILYVKFFQAISLNNNLIDETINQQLIKYTDSVPYNTDDIDLELLLNLKKTFGIELLTTNKPINSGMISLVYKMNDTINNKQIIVKIKRRGIEEKINSAIEKIKFIIQILVCIPSLNNFNIWESFNKNIHILKSQLDFEQEVKNTIRMKKECKNLKYVKVPLVYEAVTQLYKNVIVMEYIQGLHISKLDENDYEQFAKLVVKYGLVSSFVNGFSHGDLHAGNILFIKNSSVDNNEYKLGLIDFGIIMEIDENIRYKFLDIFCDFHTKKPIDISTNLLSCFVEPKKVFEDLPLEYKTSIIKMTSEIIESVMYSSKSLNQSKIFDFIVNFNSYLNANDLKKYGLYFNDDFIKMQMGISMAQGVCLSLCKGTYIEIANQVYSEVFHNEIFSEEELLL